MMIHNGDHAEYEQVNAIVDPKQRSDWPLPSFDAQDWAEAFMKSWGHRLDKIDTVLMIGWFANALMRGYDERGGK